MTLPASGIHVANTAFYYPQTSIWKTLDPGQQHVAIHNRYHRLLLHLKTLPHGTSYTLESPRLDEVRVNIDPDQFDFRLLGTTAVLLAPSDGMKLRSNASVTLVKMTDQWVLFKVLQ